MERKNDRLPIFTERFRELQGEKSNTEFADFLGISRQTVGFYYNGDRVPDALTLVKISQKCGVSTDWILGLTKDKSSQPRVADMLGISSTAVDKLMEVSKYFPDILLDILSSDGFFGFIVQINHLKIGVSATKQAHEMVHKEGLCISHEKKNALKEFEDMMSEFLGYPVSFVEPRHALYGELDSVKMAAENLAKEISGYNNLSTAELLDSIYDFEERDITKFSEYIRNKYDK